MAAEPYELLVQAALQLVATGALDSLDEGDDSLASRFVQFNHAALESARDALSQHCRVPLRYDDSFFAEHCEGYRHLRNLARAFRSEAEVAASCDEYDRAARAGIDVLELANAVRRGGLMTDLLVGIAVAGIGLNTLRRMRACFDRPTRYTLIESLLRLDSECEPFADIVARDEQWERAVGVEDEAVESAIHEMIDLSECDLSHEEQQEVLQQLKELENLPRSDQRTIHLSQDQSNAALLRMLAVDLTLQFWREMNGSYPEGLAALVPEFLPTLPLDPFTEEPFNYHRDANASFVLYSTGPKGFDGEGEFGPWFDVVAGKADLCLDVYDFE